MSFFDGTPLNGKESKQIAEGWWRPMEPPTSLLLLVIDVERCTVAERHVTYAPS